MSDMKGLYNTPINRHWKRKEVEYEPTIVEKAGVIPAKVQIERLIRAGENLINYRKEMYDYGVDYESDVDPNLDVRVRQPSIDLAEVSQLKEEVDKNMKKSYESMKKDLTDNIKDDNIISSKDVGDGNENKENSDIGSGDG